MHLRDLKAALATTNCPELEFSFESGISLAAHFHVTEVGKVTKDFVDCGGTRRSSTVCMLQTLVAHDTDHRLAPGKLAKIIDKAADLGLSEDSPVEAEVQGETIELYALDSIEHNAEKLVVHLVAKQTACLAPDQCKLGALPVLDDCSGETGCC